MDIIAVFLILFVIVAVLIVLIRMSRNAIANFDERQVAVRGRAYQIGFLSMAMINIIFALLLLLGTVNTQYGASFLILSFYVGLIAFAGYSILKDAYLTSGTNYKMYLLLCAVIAAMNFFNFFSHDPENLHTVLLQSDVFLMLCNGTGFLIIFALLIAKMLLNRGEEE